MTELLLFERMSSPKIMVKQPETTAKVSIKKYKLLDNSERVLVQQIGDGSIIKRFDKTPFPRRPTDVICPHFLELKWAYGCPFDCAWCYLKGTFRFRPEGIRPAYKPYEKIELHVRKFLENVDTLEMLNTGEIADSLMKENGNRPFSKFIIPLFEKQNKYKVLFVTKSTNIKNLLEINSHKQAVISFSLNAKPVAQNWEKGTPAVPARIEAAKKLAKADYVIRIRIDPMVPIENWGKHYLHLVDEIFSKFVPERITLGSLRGLQSTINGTKEKSWVKYLKETSNWGKKIEFATRYRMYSMVIGYLKRKYRYDKIALCKETKAMWQKLGMDCRRIRCNCTL